MSGYNLDKCVPVGLLNKFIIDTKNTAADQINSNDARILRHTTVYDELDDYNIQLINDLIKEEA